MCYILHTAGGSNEKQTQKVNEDKTHNFLVKILTSFGPSPVIDQQSYNIEFTFVLENKIESIWLKHQNNNAKRGLNRIEESRKSIQIKWDFSIAK